MLGIIMQGRGLFYYVFWAAIAVGLTFAMYHVMKKAIKDALNEYKKENNSKKEGI